MEDIITFTLYYMLCIYVGVLITLFILGTIEERNKKRRYKK